MDSPLQSFLESQVPDWEDDVVAAARFKALTGQRTDWEGRFQFWKELTIKAARHLHLIVIDTDAVQHKWFLRGGLAPLCINQVLVEMCKCGDLEKVDKLAEVPLNFKWLVAQIRKGVMWASHNALGTQPMDKNIIGGRLVVTTLLQERVAEVTKSLSDSCWTGYCVTTMAQFTNLCGGVEEADIVKSHLVRINRARFFVTDGSDHIEGLKISLTEDRVPDISKLDSYMLHLYWTLEKLQLQMDVLEKEVVKSKQYAVRAFRQGDKKSAKRHIQSLKSLSESKLKCTSFQARILELLSLISEAEMTKKVSEAIKLGTDALKEHVVPLEDIHACLKELDETISSHKETAGALGLFTGGSDFDDLDLELANLELEDTHENSQISDIKVESDSHDHNQEQPNVSQTHLTELKVVEKGVAEIKLEPEPA